MYILAGVLEEPAYYAYGTSSMKYGGIGSIIGHEISHGFDTQGSQFDEIGERNNWWTWYDRYIYLYLASCYALQYNDYKWDGHKVDGYKTLDENIADNTGLEQTYRAYRKWVKIQGAEEEQLPDLDLTHDQIFFVSYAQLWCTKVREEVYQHFINHERHSHGNVRVQGPISNSQYFARAFNCKINSTMNPEKKCFLFDMYN
ncbi:neprilysin-like isoform X2 [Physella acuta]|nr:neprilysin-like isoform X2 [Physella acuta]